MENQTTIRSEMKTRAATLPGESRLFAEDEEVAPPQGRKLLWVAIALVLFGVVWLVSRR